MDMVTFALGMGVGPIYCMVGSCCLGSPLLDPCSWAQNPHDVRSLDRELLDWRFWVQTLLVVGAVASPSPLAVQLEEAWGWIQDPGDSRAAGSNLDSATQAQR